MSKAAVIYAATEAGHVGRLYSSHATVWATAQAGNSVALGTNNDFGGHRYSGTYSVRHLHLEFDTSVIPDGATVEGVTLVLNGDTYNYTDDGVHTIEAHAWSFGAELTTDDWCDPRNLGDPLASMLSSAWSTSADNLLVGGAAFIAAINKAGMTQLVMSSDRARSSTAPTGRNNTCTDTAGDTRPRLIVQYSDAGSGDVDLESVIELIGTGLSSSTSSTPRNHQRSMWPADADEYDGATYYFEIVASNSHASAAYTVSLVDMSDQMHVFASVSVPAGTGTTPTRIRSSAFGLPVGGKEMRVRLPQTGSSDQLKVFSARIVIVQENASKTRLQYNLATLAGYASSATYGTGIITSTATDWTRDESLCPPFKLEKSALATIKAGTPWTLEAVFACANAAKTGRLQLYNLTKGVAVTGAEVNGAPGSTDIIYTVDFANDAANFDADDLFTIRYKLDSADTLYLKRAALYVRLDGISKVLLHRSVVAAQAAAATEAHLTDGRALYESSGFASSDAGLEVWARQTAALQLSLAACGYVRCNAASFDNAAEGIGTLAAATGGGSYYPTVGTQISGDHYVYQAFYKFDTSSLPGDEFVASLISTLLVRQSNTGTTLDIEVRAYDWGDSLTTDDFIPRSELGDHPLLASGTMTITGNLTITFTDNFANLIDPAGAVRFVVTATVQRTGPAPVGDGPRFQSANGTTNKLNVTGKGAGLALYEDGSNDSGAGGSLVGYADVGANYALERSVALSLVDARRYYLYRPAGRTVALGAARVVVGGVFILWAGGLVINGGAASTDDNDVTLTMDATANGHAPDQMCFSENGSSWSGWESYATTKAWQLPAQDDEDPHTCTVYARFKYGDSVSPSVSDSITLRTPYVVVTVPGPVSTGYPVRYYPHHEQVKRISGVTPERIETGAARRR